MSADPPQDRHSVALTADLIQDPDQKAKREAENGLRQFDRAMQIVDDYLATGRPFKLRLSLIFDLHREALDGISSYAGNFRPAGIDIQGSNHQPVGAYLVAEEVEHMCDYVNANWLASSAIHLAAYVMWRLNWIHPFTDGNGRTSRILSYLILCIRAGYRLPGKTTIPEQIAQNKKPYYDALEKSDIAFKENQKIDVSAMETLLEGYLAKQLVVAHQSAITP